MFVRVCRCRSFVLALLIALAAGGASTAAYAQQQCAKALPDAERQYAVGDDAAAIGLLSGCVNQAMDDDEAIGVLRVLVQAHLRSGDERQATMALVQLLGIEPLYEPDPDRDPRTYSAFVGEVKAVLQLPSEAAFRCDREMAEAQIHYDEGTLSQTIGALEECLARSEISTAEVVRAHRMLALTHLRLGALEDAREAVVALLSRAPDYEADPVRDIPAYASLVGIVRKQLAAGLLP